MRRAAIGCRLTYSRISRRLSYGPSSRCSGTKRSRPVRISSAGSASIFRYQSVRPRHAAATTTSWVAASNPHHFHHGAVDAPRLPPTVCDLGKP